MNDNFDNEWKTKRRNARKSKKNWKSIDAALVFGGARTGTAIGGGERKRKRLVNGLVRSVGADVPPQFRQRRAAVAGVAGRKEAGRLRRRQGPLPHADQNDDGAIRLSAPVDRRISRTGAKEYYKNKKPPTTKKILILNEDPVGDPRMDFVVVVVVTVLTDLGLKL